MLPSLLAYKNSTTIIIAQSNKYDDVLFVQTSEKYVGGLPTEGLCSMNHTTFPFVLVS